GGDFLRSAGAAIEVESKTNRDFSDERSPECTRLAEDYLRPPRLEVPWLERRTIRFRLSTAIFTCTTRPDRRERRIHSLRTTRPFLRAITRRLQNLSESWAASRWNAARGSRTTFGCSRRSRT